MPSGLFQGQGTTEQASAVGINSLQIGPGSPVMNRMEAGGETGGDRNHGQGLQGQGLQGQGLHGQGQLGQGCMGTAGRSQEPGGK